MKHFLGKRNHNFLASGCFFIGSSIPGALSWDRSDSQFLFLLPHWPGAVCQPQSGRARGTLCVMLPLPHFNKPLESVGVGLQFLLSFGNHDALNSGCL